MYLIDVIFIFIVVFCTFLLIKNYLRAKRMIDLSNGAQYPAKGEPTSTVITGLGEVEALEYRSKKWKTKRLIFILSTATFLILASLTLLSDGIRWSNTAVFLIIPMNILLFNRVPSFLIMNTGIYIDERFFQWGKLKDFTISPVKMGSAGYGMFDNSTDYTELKFTLTNTMAEPKYVHLLAQEDLERVRHLLKEKGVVEGITDVKKQRTN